MSDNAWLLMAMTGWIGAFLFGRHIGWGAGYKVAFTEAMEMLKESKYPEVEAEDTYLVRTTACDIGKHSQCAGYINNLCVSCQCECHKGDDEL